VNPSRNHPGMVQFNHPGMVDLAGYLDGGATFSFVVTVKAR
jgi:hypothetical protein